MKEIYVSYVSTWTTSLEVEDDFEPTPANLTKLAYENQRDFNFKDSDWALDSFDLEDGTTIYVDEDVDSGPKL